MECKYEGCDNDVNLRIGKKCLLHHVAENYSAGEFHEAQFDVVAARIENGGDR